jgi:exodeoxyribonuclease-3
MPLSVATWNINSVRLRIGLVRRFLHEHAPDVLCLQETKCPDGNFPFAAFKAAGYRHVEIHGQKGYHGVAIISRLPLVSVDKRRFCGKEDARHIAATVDHGGRPVTIHNLYIPAGGDEPDPEVNHKFAHKLSFLDELQGCMDALARPAQSSSATSTWRRWNRRLVDKQLLKVGSHTPVETVGARAGAHGGRAGST